MIVFLRGTVQISGQGFVDVDVHGMGYRVWVPERTVSTLPIGEACFVYVHHHIREDAQQLFGFETEADRSWFELMLTVSGIGPKGALQIVSACDLNGFMSAIAIEDVAYLSTLPGIGKKTAGRLVVELKDKVNQVQFVNRATKSQIRRSTPRVNTVADDIVAALVSLGYPEKQASDVVQDVVDGEQAWTIEDGLRACLQQMNLGHLTKSR